MNRRWRARLMKVVDKAFAESLRHLPMKDGAPDPDRAPAEFQAVLRTGERETPGRLRDMRPGVLADGAHLRIDRGEHPELSPRKGDKFVALERPGQPIFEALSIDDRSHLRLIVDLGDVR